MFTGAHFLRRKQHGLAGVAILVIAAALISTMVLGPIATNALRSAKEVSFTDAVYIADVSDKVRAFYESNLASFDNAVAPTLGEAALIKAANIAPRANLRVVPSNRLAGPVVQYRRIAIWLAPAGVADTSAFNADTGVFTPAPGVVATVVDGQAIQGLAYDRAFKRMQYLASLLQRRFQTKFQSDPLRTVTVNHFRPVSGTCATSLDDIPCIDVMTPFATAANWTTLLGMSTAEINATQGPWNTPIQISNLAQSNTAAPPYTMALALATPWGTSINVSAVQPIN
jgi:hypothetical protein